MILIKYLIKILYRYLKIILLRLTKKQKKFSFGNLMPNDTVYIIKRDDARVGLFSYFITNLGQIAYAHKKNYIPVIDMKNFPNSYLEDDKLGKENSWEYYFSQPDKVSLENAYKSNKVIISYFDPWKWPSDSAAFFKYRTLIMKKWRKYVERYIHLSYEVEDYVSIEYNRLFKPGERILGVKCRGTDYLALKPKGHPIQPSIDVVIKKAKEVIQQYSIDKLYISTEDELIEKEFEKSFEKGFVVKSTQIRREYDGINYISEMTCSRENDKYLNGLEYLTSILILSKCNCFISGRNSGAVGVMLFADDFEYDYIWDLGNY